MKQCYYQAYNKGKYEELKIFISMYNSLKKILIEK